jgi:hypothetical protein
MKRRILNFLISLDQFLFVILSLGNASPDETLSAAAWRWELEGRRRGKILRPIIDKMFWFDPEHCKMSFYSEINKTQLPETYR